MKVTLHVVWSRNYPSMLMRPISEPIPKVDAIKLVQKQWSRHIAARLEPPLRPTLSKE